MMCGFLSWYRRADGQVDFLTNADLPRAEALGIIPEDFLGHGALAAVRGWAVDNQPVGQGKECTDFSSPTNFPPEIVRALKTGQMTYAPVPLELLCPGQRKAYLARAAAIKADWVSKGKRLDTRHKRKHALVAAVYWDQRDALSVMFRAKCDALGVEDSVLRAVTDVGYQRQCKAVDGARLTLRTNLNLAHHQERGCLDSKHLLDIASLEARYWGIFARPKNRAEAWR